MDLFNNISDNYSQKPKAGFEGINFWDQDKAIRWNVTRAVKNKLRRKDQKTGLSEQLLFDNLNLSPERLEGIERLIKHATTQKIIPDHVKDEIRKTIKERDNWNSSYGRQPKAELEKKIRAKIFSIEIALNLVLSNPNSELFSSYLNTIYYCQSMYSQDGYKITSKYCNNRHCYSCNRIRAGKLINSYTPFINFMKQDSDMWFVTLTIPNVSAGELRESIEDMKRTFVYIKDCLRKEKMKIVGLRKLECTHNHQADTYHPHFHLLIKGKDVAEAIKSRWLSYFKNANEMAQDIRQADDNSVKELFKYFTKFWSRAKNGDHGVLIDYRAQDIIFNSIRGMRIFQPYGLKVFKQETGADIDQSEEVENFKASFFDIAPQENTFYFNPATLNYFSPDTAEEIIEYRMSEKDQHLLERINMSILQDQEKLKSKQELIDPLLNFVDTSWQLATISDRGGGWNNDT